jgi:hypothetical protein
VHVHGEHELLGKHLEMNVFSSQNLVDNIYFDLFVHPKNKDILCNQQTINITNHFGIDR